MEKNTLSVGIIGGGLAGLSAAVALAGRGFRVELFESRPHLGGRAGSFWEPTVGRWIDFGQHVLMGCCSQMLRFCQQTGLDQFLCRYRKIYFVDLQGRTYPLKSNRLLPAPLHLAPAFCRFGFLSCRDRLKVLCGLAALFRSRQPLEEMTFGQWLLAQGQTPSAIRRFWTPVVLSALADVPERVALSAARNVFVEGLLGSREAFHLLRPTRPWGHLLDEYLGQWLAQRGVVLHRHRPIRHIDANIHQVRHLVLKDGTWKTFDFYILAVPWRQAAGLLPPALHQAIPQLARATLLEPGAITTWHLWLDRPISQLPQAVIVGGRIQWVFSGLDQCGEGQPALQRLSYGKKECTFSASPERLKWWAEMPPHQKENSIGSKQGIGEFLPNKGRDFYYYQVVLSATHALPTTWVPQTIEEVLGELQGVFPAAKGARLLGFRRVKMHEAVFSPQPHVDPIRPSQNTPIENLALAGDWTATGWPATMESAVRSGLQAAKVALERLKIY
ncbi:MAG: hydroxysqualene dehydroxylase HpnE [Thermoguttaceae bacterium]|nr:hydroxysqualene dehydroxylase HpnE [Thermoguttaceae bacterium]